MLQKAPKRVGFFEKEEIIDLPNLIEIQVKSFSQFLQADKFPEERENVGEGQNIGEKDNKEKREIVCSTPHR